MATEPDPLSQVEAAAMLADPYWRKCGRFPGEYRLFFSAPTDLPSLGPS
jgi:hypothetical protein